MTGAKSGVAAQIKKLNEKCLLTHCYSHSLLDMAYEINKLIKKSPAREAEFPRKQAELLAQIECDFHVDNMDSPTLKSSV